MTLRTGLVAVAAVALALIAALEIAAGPQSQEPALAPGHTLGTRLEGKGIPNFGQVSPNLFRGAMPSAEGIATLHKNGVDIVVDLRGGVHKNEEAAVTKLGMRYVPIPSRCQYPVDQPFAAFLKVVEENAGKKIFVHCRLGEDRTGMAVASYRMAEQGWSAGEAMKEMQAFGYGTTHHATCPGLAQYEAQFPQRLQKAVAFRDLQTARQGK